MIRGVGLFRRMVAKDSGATKKLIEMIAGNIHSSAAATRATLVSTGNEIVIVEEWESQEAFDHRSSSLNQEEIETTIASYCSTLPTREFFPEALHICRPTTPVDKQTIGILVRQRTSSETNGYKLRDAQRENYERQMTKEPGCTCCIILAGSSQDNSQVRIIELWDTMNDFYFHESSEWHALGEEKVVPLVVDMDCDFVKGMQLLQS